MINQTLLRLLLPLSLAGSFCLNAQPASTVAEPRSDFAPQNWRVILDNDGGDVFGQGSKAWTHPDDPVAEFLSRRTAGLEKTGVTTITYCSGWAFGLVLHRSKVAHQFDPAEVSPEKRGQFPLCVIEALAKKGTDPLAEIVNYGRRHGIEVFWSMRMNDTHDAKNRDLLSPFKQQHPDWLLWADGKRTAFGAETSVNWAEAGVRDFALALIRETLENYDVNGVELDFFRHPILFRSAARGGVATGEERDLLTDFMRRVRPLLAPKPSADGQSNPKPRLLGVRVPDSLAYCRDAGMDLETWLKEGLLDFVVFGGYFRLADWSESAALARKYGVPSYASLDMPVARIPETPIQETPPIDQSYGWISDGKVDGRRRDLESYRGRIVSAVRQGHSGVAFFNYWGQEKPIFSELRDPHKLEAAPKKFFHMVRGTQQSPSKFLQGGNRYFTQPIINPGYPHAVTAEPLEIDLFVWMAPPPLSGEEPGQAVEITLDTAGSEGPAKNLRFSLNGTRLEADAIEGATLRFYCPSSRFKQGGNRLSFVNAGQSSLVIRDVLVRTPF